MKKRLCLLSAWMIIQTLTASWAMALTREEAMVVFRLIADDGLDLLYETSSNRLLSTKGVATVGASSAHSGDDREHLGSRDGIESIRLGFGHLPVSQEVYYRVTQALPSKWRGHSVCSESFREVRDGQGFCASFPVESLPWKDVLDKRDQGGETLKVERVGAETFYRLLNEAAAALGYSFRFRAPTVEELKGIQVGSRLLDTPDLMRLPRGLAAHPLVHQVRQVGNFVFGLVGEWTVDLVETPSSSRYFVGAPWDYELSNAPTVAAYDQRFFSGDIGIRIVIQNVDEFLSVVHEH